MDDIKAETLTLSCTKKKELPQIVEQIFAFAKQPDSYGVKVWLFVGGLGAGKTTLIKEICRFLGVNDEVASPTFAIINEYLANVNPVYHFDFYRLKNEKEAIDIGVEEYFYSGNYCFIEWPQKVENILPDELLLIHIEGTDHENRVFKLTKHG